ncbi:MAG TPA: ABC transporter substrate-binding protein [Firmicutes bacterium]|nr:ABC transporter substrate-binding protein [Bacillota bacterium]
MKRCLFSLGIPLLVLFPWSVVAQNVVKVGMEQIPSSFDPFGAYTGAEAAFFELFFDSLYRLGPGGSLIPWLAAEEPHILEVGNQLQMVIPLRSGVRWHDGNSFTVEDVLYTFQEIYLNPQHPRSSLWRTAVLGAEATGTDEISLVINGERMLYVFELLCRPLFPQGFAQGGPVPVQDLVGTGPFLFNDRLGDGYLTVRRNWWYHAQGWQIEGGSVGPHLSGLLFKAVPAAGVEEAFQRKDIDLFLGTAQLDPARAYWISCADGIRLLAFNLRRNPGGDRAFRRAIAAVTGQLLAELGDLGPSPIPFARPEEPARNILAQAGYTWDEAGSLIFPNGSPLPELRLVVLAGEKDFWRRFFAQGLREKLAELGVKVELTEGDTASLLETVFLHYDYDLLIYGWQISQGFPVHLVELLYSGTAGQFGPNISGFAHPEYDFHVAKLLAADSLGEISAQAGELVRIVAEELPLLPLFFNEDGFIHSKDSSVRRYFNFAGGFWSFAGFHFAP